MGGHSHFKRHFLLDSTMIRIILFSFFLFPFLIPREKMCQESGIEEVLGACIEY